MKTIIQYRYVENDAVIGEGPVETSEPVDPVLIPTVGDVFPLYPPATEGYAKVIAVEDDLKAELRLVTIKIERI